MSVGRMSGRSYRETRGVCEEACLGVRLMEEAGLFRDFGQIARKRKPMVGPEEKLQSEKNCSVEEMDAPCGARAGWKHPCVPFGLIIAAADAYVQVSTPVNVRNALHKRFGSVDHVIPPNSAGPSIAAPGSVVTATSKRVRSRPSSRASSSDSPRPRDAALFVSLSDRRIL